MRLVNAIRYVTPLREGGSLPAIIECDDGELYVVKFRGAGQGTRALAAEVIAAGVAGALELPIPECTLVQLDQALARTERHQEIADLLAASVGVNFGIGYLPSSVMFSRGADRPPPSALATAIVWFDAFLMNVDRTIKNPNLLVWKDALWLIDHGAALYWQHGWERDTDRSGDRFALVRDHVLLPWADELEAAGPKLAARLTEEVIDSIVAPLPDDWLTGPPFDSPAAMRDGYKTFLRKRRDSPVFLEEAINARRRL